MFKKSYFSYVILILSLGVLLLFNFDRIGKFPWSNHTWAQADRYALANGFVDNGYNILLPQTYIYNHQFPNWWKTEDSTSITAVDFPIHDYIPAIFMGASGSRSVLFYQLYVMLMSAFAILYLFKMVLLLYNDLMKAAIVVVFALTTPLFLFYSVAMLPTLPGIALSMMGFFHFFTYRKTEKEKYFRWAIVFLGIAALSRTTFVIPLIAVLASEMIAIILGKSKIQPKIVVTSFVLMSILGYKLYNHHLALTYGSQFLSELMPPTHWEDFKHTLNEVYQKYKWVYLSKTQLIGVVLLLLTTVWRRKKINQISTDYLLLLSIYFVGVMAFAIAMLHQFPNHDYYFLDAFFIPMMLLVIYLVKYVPSFNFPIYKIALVAGIIVFSFAGGISAQHEFDLRESRWSSSRQKIMVDQFAGVEELLNNNNIPKDASFLILDAIAPNLPFSLINRSGYAIMETNMPNIKNALQWDYDYLITQNQFFQSDIYAHYPEILDHLYKVTGNGYVTISTYSNSGVENDLTTFTELPPKPIVYREYFNFENERNEVAFWCNYNSISNPYSPNAMAGYVDRNNEFGLTFKTEHFPVFTTASRTVTFKGDFFSKKEANVLLVFSLKEDGISLVYKAIPINTATDITQEFTINLPQVKSEKYEFACFVWSPDKTEILYDNIELSIQ